MNIFDVTTGLTIDNYEDGSLIWPFGRYPTADHFKVSVYQVPDSSGEIVQQVVITVNEIPMDVDWVHTWLKGLQAAVTIARVREMAFNERVSLRDLYLYSEDDMEAAGEKAYAIAQEKFRELMEDEKLRESASLIIRGALRLIHTLLIESKWEQLEEWVKPTATSTSEAQPEPSSIAH